MVNNSNRNYTLILTLNKICPQSVKWGRTAWSSAATVQLDSKVTQSIIKECAIFQSLSRCAVYRNLKSSRWGLVKLGLLVDVVPCWKWLTLIDAHCCHMCTAIKQSCARPGSAVIHIFLTSGHSDAQDWAPECPDVKYYEWRLDPV